MLAVRLKYLSNQDAAKALNLIIEISKMLTSLRARFCEQG